MNPKQEASAVEELPEQFGGMAVGATSNAPVEQYELKIPSVTWGLPLLEAKKRGGVMKLFLNVHARNMVKMERRIFGIYKNIASLPMDEETANATLRIKIRKAFNESKGHCPYCHRIFFFMIPYAPVDEKQFSLTVSCDHIDPGSSVLDDTTKLQLTCQQCNSAKSSAPEHVFMAYIRNVRSFYLDSLKAYPRQVDKPLSNPKERLEEVKSWTNKFTEYKNTYLQKLEKYQMQKDPAKVWKPITNEELDTKVKRLQKTDEFLYLATTCGLRDPFTGVESVWDSSMENPNRLEIAYMEVNRKLPRFVTTTSKANAQKFKDLKYHYTHYFTYNAFFPYKDLEVLEDWLEALRHAKHDFIQN